MLQGYNRLLDEVRSMGGEIVGLTGDTQANANGAQKAWSIDFPLLADPSCQLTTLLNEKGWITTVIERSGQAGSTMTKEFTQKYLNMAFAVGMLQPGVVALRGPVDDDADAGNAGVGGGGADVEWAAITREPEVLVTWGSVPTTANVNGATNRLAPKAAIAAVKASLAGDFSLARPAVVQGKGSRFGMDNPSLPLFYALLVANGNFIGPKPFVQNPDGTGNVNVQQMTAMKKLVVAMGLTGVGLFQAPAEIATVLVLYAVWLLRPGGPWDIIKTGWQPASRSKL